jgi:hypothetical protein
MRSVAAIELKLRYCNYLLSPYICYSAYHFDLDALAHKNTDCYYEKRLFK